MDTAGTALPDATPESSRAREGAPMPPGSRWANLAWIVSSVVLVVLVVAIWMRVSDGRASADLTNAIIKGDRPAAPALPTDPVSSGTGLPDWYRASGDHQAAGDDNQVLVVNWWASWCGPCKDEAPVLEDVAKDYDGRVVVVGLNAGAEDLRSDAREFAKEHEITFPLVRGDRNDKSAWGVTGYPETFVVGTDGHISSYVNGPVDSRTLRAMLDDELDQDRGGA
ncbi:MAG: TlpA family protein disulfide reductase [Thermoleophilia bacterium]|nr:TlpA family protein disulfide reductase [Thermoleophilia bacterium]